MSVATYLTGAGFKNVAATPDNMLVTADGTAAIASKAFNTKIDVVSIGGKRIFANVKAAQVPTALAGTVTAIEGLSDLPMHLNMRFRKTRSHGARYAASTKSTPLAANQPCEEPVGSLCVLNGYSATGFQLAYDSPQHSGNTNLWVYTGKSTTIAIFAEGHIDNALTD